jgi:hypothetical protein
MSSADPLDLVIVGGGIGGVISLHYARKAGLRTLLLEKQQRIGGLWARLPAWQDIQISPYDWTLGDIPLSGVHQPSIQRNIEAWVDKFGLADSIRLGTPVERIRETTDGWEVTTPSSVHRARHLICATGGENIPYIPPAIRTDAAVREFHSSDFHDPAGLEGKVVVVVGGGSSAFDLLDLALENHASRVVWVYRGTRWMIPTLGSKQFPGYLRRIARQRLLGVPAEQISREMDLELRRLYAKHGLEEIQPECAFDLSKDPLLPGRRLMISEFHRIERIRSDVSAIRGRTIRLSTGDEVDADFLLWATGFEMDLAFFEAPELARLRRLGDLSNRCGCIFRSLDAQRLYFLGVILGGSGSAPWAYSHACRTIISHIVRKTELDLAPVPETLDDFELIRFLAKRDPLNFPPGQWAGRYHELFLDLPEDEPLPIPE